ncbi:MAG: hypothetical protein JW860_01255 [Sedimentisphaerales bacterium]|nr:hypothetical protein [Sedimentisphaerales bacterium]
MSQDNKKSTQKHEVVFYTYPKFIFCWPLIAMGFLLWAFDKWQWLEPETLAWIWGITLIIVLITVGFDLNRNYTIFWMVLIAFFWILIYYLRDVKQVEIFSRIYNIFAELNPVYSRNFGIMISIALLVLSLVMWIWTRLNSKWRITHNEFEHYQFGRMDDSLARGAKRVRTSYPDFFELVLCLAGDLIIFDSTGRRELRRIPHVPLLPLVRKKINRILETTAITAGEMEDEAEAYEDFEDTDEEGQHL